MKILITSLGSNTAIGVIKALKTFYNSITIVGCDINNYSECNGVFFADYFEKISPAKNVNFITQLCEIISKHSIDCVIPIHDREIEVISINSSLVSKYSKIMINHHDIINICNDKIKCSKYLSEICNIPKIYDRSKDDIGFPSIMKEISGVGSSKIKLIKSRHELPNIIPKDMMIQEFISGIEYTVDCYTSYLNSQVKCVVRKRNEIKSGMSTKGEIISHPKIEKICEKIHQSFNYKGVSNIQFIENDKEIYFIEINPRFAGGGILTYKNGFNIPVIAINELLMQKAFDPPNDCKPEIGAKMVRYLKETFFDKDDNRI